MTKVLYTYVSKTNKNYADKMALKANRTTSEFIDELLSSHRLKRPFKFSPKLLKSEERLLAVKKRRNKKIKSLK